MFLFRNLPLHRLGTVLFATFFMLSACGGSGGNSSGSASLMTQEPLVFAETSVTLPADETDYSNAVSGGSGSGAISYETSDAAVAEVDGTTGEVTAVSPGSASITATKAEDDVYFEASASYDLSVVGLSGFDVSTNLADTEITWDQQSETVNVYRSTDESCDIANYASCPDSEMTVANVAPAATPLVDTYIDLSTPAYLFLEFGEYASDPLYIEPMLPPFPERNAAGLIKFQDKLLVVAGYDHNFDGGTQTKWYNDVWSTTDGKTWTEQTSAAAFPARARFAIVEFNDELYLIGGNEGIGTGGASLFKSDTWKSSDGILWQQMSETAPFHGGVTGETVVFRDRIWMIGGGASAGDTGIWSTTDGVTWTEELAVAPFGARQRHVVFVADDRLILIGGEGSGGSADLRNDVWSSPDGITWTQEATTSNFSPRVQMHVERLGGKYWLIGGHSYSSAHATAYRSDDGITWTLAATDIVPELNQLHSVEAFDDKLWLLPTSYLWRSDDATDWRAPIQTSIAWNN